VAGYGGAVAPPPVPPRVVVSPGVAPPGPVAPPPLVNVGGAPAVPIAVASGPRVLVGFLVTFQNDPGGAFWPIHSGRTQVGRAGGEGVDVAIPDASASSRHAVVTADPSTGQAFVEDDGSRNGTFLNEQRLVAGDRRQLRDSDRLRVGSTTFVVKLLVS
jgi:pSer/pThr/pTyr-binding forkhead associated (FHA) protein